MTTIESRVTGRPPGEEHPCWLDVDLDAVADNVRALTGLVGQGTRVCAVVKAEAYGLGAVEVARTALAAGAERVAVARVDEAVKLRNAGIQSPILLLAGFAQSEVDAIVRHQISPSIVDVHGALAVARTAGRMGKVVDVHIKVDTGLTRFGATPGDVATLVKLLAGFPTVRLEGLYSHFAAADEADRGFTEQQLHRLYRVVEAVERLGDPGWRPSIVHAANSAATLREPASWLHMVRPGICLSGHYPSEHVPPSVGLRPAVSLRARLMHVRGIPPGTSIGYNRTFVADRPLLVGLVPAGYADGVPRSHSNRGFAAIRGRRAPLIGRISMDQCVVDLTSVPDARSGDVVTLFGAADSEDGGEVTLDEFAGWSDTIVHEALCRVGGRVPRRYTSGGRAWWGSVSEAFAGALS